MGFCVFVFVSLCAFNKLQTSVSGFETRLKQSEEDSRQLKDTAKQYEKLIDEYKEQVENLADIYVVLSVTHHD